MKNKTAIFFVLLANIIIVAHAVVPHHHLPHQSFFLTAQTAEAENRHHHPESSDFDHDHDHDNKSDNEHCLLNRVIGLPTNTVRQICGCDFHADFHPDLGGFYAVLLFIQFECVVPAVTVRLRRPLFAFSYISYASSVLGLRAPPAV